MGKMSLLAPLWILQMPRPDYWRLDKNTGKRRCRLFLPCALCRDLLLLFIIRVRLLDGIDLTS